MAMTLVSTVTVGSGGASSIEFTNIPQTGKDLLVLYSSRSTTDSIAISLRLNGDTGSNYRNLMLRGDGSSVTTFASSLSAQMELSNSSAQSSSTANTFGNAQFIISNYTSSTSKSLSLDAVNENNATTAYAGITAGQYTGTSAISSLSLLSLGFNFVQHSTASLYIIS